MNSKVVAVILVAVVIVAAVGGYMVMNKGGDDNKIDDPDTKIAVKTLDRPEDTLLRVFGNVNGDAYINDDDVSMLVDILNGKTEQTFYADVNQDGYITAEDVDYLKGIIKGDSTRLYYQNYKYDTKSVAVPVGNITVIYYQVLEAVALLGAYDRVVASDEYSVVDKASQFPGAENIKNLGNKAEITAEDLMSAGTKTIISGSAAYHISEDVEKALPADYDMVRLCNGASGLEIVWHVVTLGYILGSDGGYEYLDFYNKVMDLINDRTKDLKESDMETSMSVYFDSSEKFKIHCKNSGSYEVLQFAKTKNTAEGLYEKYNTLYYYADPEFVYASQEQNGLDRFVFTTKSQIIGSNQEDFMKTYYDYMKASGLDKLESYQSGKSIAICYNLTNSTPLMLGPLVLASIIYPDLFEDVDVYEYLQEFYDKFTLMDFDVKTDAFFFCTSQDLIDAGYTL